MMKLPIQAQPILRNINTMRMSVNSAIIASNIIVNIFETQERLSCPEGYKLRTDPNTGKASCYPIPTVPPPL